MTQQQTDQQADADADAPAGAPARTRASRARVARRVLALPRAVQVGALAGVLIVLVALPLGLRAAREPAPAQAAHLQPAPTAGSPAGGGSAPGAAGVRWLSGAASDEAADGRFGRWRGAAVAIGGTWDNGNEEQLAMATICPGGPWATWDRPLDVAVGAIDVDAGESWAAAAQGAYDQRWRTHLERVRLCWGERDPGLLYLRFAHEMNLPQKWRVSAGEEADFVRAITRYSDLRYEIIPGSKIVLCPNDGTDSSLGGLDVRKLWPGRDGRGRPVADVYAVDSYNSSPHVTTAAEFTRKVEALAADGSPLGLERHRQFAEAKGVPFAVPEWSNNGDPAATYGGGESAEYVRAFHDWARRHGGDPARPRAGQLLYEIHFNLWDQYAFYPRTMQPQTAAAYRALPWGS